MSERATKFFTPSAVYMSADGGEYLVRKMASGFHVIGPYTCDSLGYWKSLDEAKLRVESIAGEGQWTS